MVMPNDQHLDDAIDRAVRELMSVDPPEGLRGRVFARIEERPSARLYGLLAGAAAVAALLLLVLLPLRSSRQEPATPVATSTPAPAPLPPRVSAGDVPPSPAPVPASSPRIDSPRVDSRSVDDRRRARLAGEVVAANASVELESGPEPLVALPEIGLHSIAPTPLETSQVSVSPLVSLHRLQLDPLPPPGSQK